MVAIISRPTAERRVFFPWEQKRGLLGALGRRRARVLLAGGVLVVVVVAITRTRSGRPPSGRRARR